MKGAVAGYDDDASSCQTQRTYDSRRSHLRRYGRRGEITVQELGILRNSGMKVDRTIVGEPTDMQVGVAHKGVAWFEGVFPGCPYTEAFQSKESMPYTELVAGLIIL